MAIDLGPDGLTLGSTTINDWADVGGGKILQVVQGTLSSSASTTSTSFQNTGLQATITPASTSNKILILLDGEGGQTNSGRSAFYRVLRGSTEVARNDNLQTNTTYSDMPMVIKFLDSPSTTSATTYKIQIATDGVGTINMKGGSGTNSRSRLILLEVDA